MEPTATMNLWNCRPQEWEAQECQSLAQEEDDALPEGSFEDTKRCKLAQQYEIVGVRGTPESQYYSAKRNERL
jgi:hypothetical protein